MGELLRAENCDDKAWEYLSKQYVQNDGQTYTVQPETLNHLLRAEIILDVLMKHGVHQWSGFDEAMAAVQVELNEREDEG